MTTRRPCPCDVADEERAPVVPCLTLLRGAAGRRAHALREVFNGLRHVVENGIPRRAMPHDLPPWAAAPTPAARRRCLATLAHDRRAVPRLAGGRKAEPSAAVPDSRTLRSTPEGGHRAGRDGRRCRCCATVCRSTCCSSTCGCRAGSTASVWRPGRDGTARTSGS